MLVLYVLIGFLYLLLAGMVVLLVLLIYFAQKGAPYAATDDATLQEIIKAARLKKGEKAVDVGSGDGKIVIALARAGAQAYGMEFNPVLVYWSRWKIKRLGLEKQAHILWCDFWRRDFGAYDVIVVYGIPYIMRRLERKLKAEVTPSARVISNYFTFPTWKPVRKPGRVAVYQTAKNRS